MSKLSKRAIPILIITILLTSIFSVAIPIASSIPSDYLQSINNGVATWTTDEFHEGDYSVKLTPGPTQTGPWVDLDAARVAIPVAPMKLSDITSLSFWWMAKAASGLPYVTIEMDSDDAGVDADTWLIWNIGPGQDTGAATAWTQWTLTPTPDDWHIAGATPYITTGTWADLVTAYAAYDVLKYKVSIGEGSTSLNEPVYIDDMKINGVTYLLEPGLPVADADGPYSVVEGRAITFDGTGSSDDGTIDIWTWLFAGSPTLGPNQDTSTPTCTYDDPGVYEVKLTVTDNDGLTDVDITSVTVREEGVTGISIDHVLDEDGEAATDAVKGDTITVIGSGVTAGEDVILGWDGMKEWDGEKGILNSTEAKGDGSFEMTFDVPEAIAGLHYLWVKDMDTGATDVWADDDFTVKSKISLSPDSGLEGTKVTIKGYGFDEEEDVILATLMETSTLGTPETDELGSFESTFTVEELGYGTYDVTATQVPNYAVDEFTVGASITLDIDEGPVGSVVEVKGQGFEDDDTITDAEVRITDGTTTVPCTIVDYDTAIEVKDDGTFKFEIVIPQVDMDDYDEIEVQYDNLISKWVSDGFKVTGEAEIELDPQFGVQGTKVSIEGFNFTQMSGEVVEIWLYTDEETPKIVTMIDDDFETDSNGMFDGTFTIPAKSSGKYLIYARQNDWDIKASEDFRIGLMIVIPTPASGPTGTMVTLTGTGYTEKGRWNATFGEIAIVEDDDGEVDDNSDILLDGSTPTFYVPTVDPGTYTISVLDIESEISVDVEWTVTATSVVAFDPYEAPNEYEVSISGSYFAEEKDAELEFVLYNVTSTGEADEDWTLTVIPEKPDDPGDPPKTIDLDKDGNFTVLWTVLENEDLSIGDYILNVTDEYDLFAQAHFSVVEKSIIVDPRKTSFARGETVAFDIESTFVQHESYIEIYDPNGDLYWTTDLFTDGSGTTEDMWLKVGVIQTVPYYYQTAGGNQLFLLEDAALGPWAWEWYDAEDDELASGTFKVTEAAEDILSAQLEALGGDLSQLSTDFGAIATDMSGLSADVASLSQSVADAISAANAATNAVSQVATAVRNVADTAQTAAEAAQDAVTAANSAQEAAETAGAAASGLTNLVYGAIVASLVAALAAIVSLMQISKRIAG